MINNPPAPTGSSWHIRNIAVDIVLTIFTCGLFNFLVQYKQMQAVNHMIKQEKYSYIAWFFLSLITCGLYHIYHEYRLSEDIEKSLNNTDSNEAVVSLVLCVFGLSIVADAIQQSRINLYYGSTQL